MNAPLPRLSYAVAARRIEAPDSADDFPTPLWATRAFVEHVIGPGRDLAAQDLVEPACGRLYMADALAEYFGSVEASDAFFYGQPVISDFIAGTRAAGSTDWIVTNPPFKLAEAFIQEGLRVARVGVAVLVRSSFTESVGRYERLYSRTPPTTIAQYVERVPMVKGRLDPEATTATSYGWLVWEKDRPLPPGADPRYRWIPPCRRSLERDGDYPPDLFQILRWLLR